MIVCIKPARNSKTQNNVSFSNQKVPGSPLFCQDYNGVYGLAGIHWGMAYAGEQGYLRAVVSGGAEGALAPPELGSSINSFPTRGGKSCPQHYC